MRLYVFIIALSLNYIPTLSFDCKNKGGKKLQVHLIPHSHGDPGWQKTFDEYYTGNDTTLTAGNVRRILDSTIIELAKKSERKFVYAEIAFFQRWWDEQSEDKKTVVKKLVKNGQLVFVNGGWTSNDEATTHYNGIIDQMTLGLRFINDTFGADARPTIAWNIDAFGHSAEQASLYSLMSFDGFFFGRIHDADKEKRLKEQQMEMVWRGSRNYANSSQIFSGVLYNLYDPPPGFCYDMFCDTLITSINAKESVDKFVTVTCKQALSYKTNNIMLTMGGDFQYEMADTWFANLDQLIHYVNKDGRVNTFYSTPAKYLKAVHDSNEEWNVKTDDFFPYADNPHSYWTGYFTSRPALKRYIRESNGILQACKQMEAIRGKIDDEPTSDALRRAMALVQHHDAITGTERQHVQDDYVQRLHKGRQDCQDLLGHFVRDRYPKEHSKRATWKFQRCDHLNSSVCNITETEKSIIVNIYNPVARPVNTYVSLPVNTENIVVSGTRGEVIKSQIAPISNETAKLQRNLKGDAKYEIVFEVYAPGVGFSTYFLNQTENKKSKTKKAISAESLKKNSSNKFIENEHLKLEFSIESGRLVRILRKDINRTLSVEQQFFWYNASVGKKGSKTSGAYIFRPDSSQPNNVSDENKAEIEIFKGSLVEEVRQVFGSYASQVIRLYKDTLYVEFEYTVGPIPVDDGIGKEIITRFDTDVKSDGIFYTDANGRELKERKRNNHGFAWPAKRPGSIWSKEITEPISQNYYPINSRISINDTNRRLTVMTDRSHGGSSIQDGQIEIMLHRRLLEDDMRGVKETLNEPGIDGKGLVTRGKHHVFFSVPRESARLHRMEGELMLLEPIISFASNPLSMDEWMAGYESIYSGMRDAQPDNIHLLTLETITNDTILLRFEHYFEKDEDPIHSLPVTLTNVTGMFANIKIMSLTEMNLSANQYLKDKKMMGWKTKVETGGDGTTSRKKIADEESVKKRGLKLHPMEIRTFIAKIERQNMKHLKRLTITP